ncbi:Protein kinase, putative [Hondaea fermentalgiana]|uniref:Protein kinase, putative n=1 Tax=Hondaea fermentalgiana TaxID=2315210 RepID=A0A2R5GQG4_9STRA|nr:Protein kinase, putative [Hondaea fermentalgiana]|eukprot:GBG30114.1 Protein kinase, putative [Hondaea fermentalgiana]
MAAARAEELKVRGNEAFSSGKFDEAAALYAEAIAAVLEAVGSPSDDTGKRDDDHDNDDNSEQESLALVNRAGAAAASLTRYARAAAAAAATRGDGESRTVVQSVELLPALLCNRAAALAKLGDFEAALRDAEQAVALRPAWVKAHHRKAQALAELGLLEEARDAYCVAADLEPDNSWLRRRVETLEKQTGSKSAQDKVDAYVAKHKSIKGCPTKLSMSMFEVDELLGEGNYSEVHSAVFSRTGERFAIKSVDKEKAKRMSRRHPNLNNELHMEKKLLLRLNHPNVVKLFFTMQDTRCLYYVSELATAGELWARMRYGRTALVGLPPSEALFYAAQIVNALEYLQTQHVIHRDIKPENMMLFADPAYGGRVEQLKLIDFGTAYDTDDTTLNGPNFVGTPEYMSPEAIAGKAAPTYALDLWALATTLFQLHSGRIPFKGNSPYLTFLKTQALNYEMPNYFSPTLQDLLERVFVETPEDRIGATDCLASIKQHPAFAGVDFAAILLRPTRPVPSLFEICAQATLRVLTGPPPPLKGPGADVRLPEFPKQKTLPAWARTVGTFSNSRAGSRIRNCIMGMLAQRLALRNQNIFKLFFESDEAARFHRAERHQFAGLSEPEEGKFHESFLLVHLGSLAGASTASIEATMRRVNRLEPAPRLVICGGALGKADELKPALCRLDSAIAVVCVPDGRPPDEYRTDFGDNYYSLYVQGVMILVIDSFELALLATEGGVLDSEKAETSSSRNHGISARTAARQAEWLEHQVLEGKLCARHVLVVSHHMWFYDAADAESAIAQGIPVMPRMVCDRFLDKFQESGVQMVLSGAMNEAIVKSRKPRNEMEPKMRLTSTPAHVGSIDADDAQGLLRVIRVQPSDVVSDMYTRASLPPWFALEEEEPNSDVEVGLDDGKQHFSDISSDSSDDEEE